MRLLGGNRWRALGLAGILAGLLASAGMSPAAAQEVQFWQEPAPADEAVGCVDLHWIAAEAPASVSFEVHLPDAYPQGYVVTDGATGGSYRVCLPGSALVDGAWPATAQVTLWLTWVGGRQVTRDLTITLNQPATTTAETGASDSDLWLEADGACVIVHWHAPGAVRAALVTLDENGSEVGSEVAVPDGSTRACPSWWTFFALGIEYPDGTFETITREFTPGAIPTSVVPPAPTMPPYLVLTHIARLNARLGATAWADVEALLDGRYGRANYRVLDFGSEPVTANVVPACPGNAICQQAQAFRDLVLAAVAAEGRPTYIIIIGGPDVVPFGAWANPCWSASDQDIVWTDDWYGDIDGDVDHIPDVAVSRVPDGSDLGLIEAVFAANDRTALPADADTIYAHGQPLRPYAVEMAHRLMRNDPTHPAWSTAPRWTPDPNPNARPTLQMTWADYNYFILHGDWRNTSEWYGEDASVPKVWNAAIGRWVYSDPATAYPVAFTVAAAGSEGLVISEACYGAFTSGGQTAADSIALHFLESGAFAFVGSTAMTYSSLQAAVIDEGLTICTDSILGLFGETCVVSRPRVVDPLSNGVQALVWSVFEIAQIAQPPADAYLRGKQNFAQETGLRHCGEQKALNSFVYYGLPPAPAYVEPEGG